MNNYNMNKYKLDNNYQKVNVLNENDIDNEYNKLF